MNRSNLAESRSMIALKTKSAGEQRRPEVTVSFKLVDDMAVIWSQMRRELGLTPSQLVLESVKARAAFFYSQKDDVPLKVPVKAEGGKVMDLELYLGLTKPRADNGDGQQEGARVKDQVAKM